MGVSAHPPPPGGRGTPNPARGCGERGVSPLRGLRVWGGPHLGGTPHSPPKSPPGKWGGHRCNKSKIGKNVGVFPHFGGGGGMGGVRDAFWGGSVMPHMGLWSWGGPAAVWGSEPGPVCGHGAPHGTAPPVPGTRSPLGSSPPSGGRGPPLHCPPPPRGRGPFRLVPPHPGDPPGVGRGAGTTRRGPVRGGRERLPTGGSPFPPHREGDIPRDGGGGSGQDGGGAVGGTRGVCGAPGTPRGLLARGCARGHMGRGGGGVGGLQAGAGAGGTRGGCGTAVAPPWHRRVS